MDSRGEMRDSVVEELSIKSTQLQNQKIIIKITKWGFGVLGFWGFEEVQ